MPTLEAKRFLRDLRSGKVKQIWVFVAEDDHGLEWVFKTVGGDPKPLTVLDCRLTEGVPRRRLRTFCHLVYPSDVGLHSLEDLSEEVDVGFDKGRPRAPRGYTSLGVSVCGHSINLVESGIIA